MPVQETSTLVIAAPGHCPRCGGSLGGFGPEGLCGTCLLGAGLGEGAPAAEEAPGMDARRFGDYELLGEVARGGMGVVFRARQLSLDRMVALKMILGGSLADAEGVRRFRQEAAAAAQLKHPNIVAIHEVGEHEGQPFFSMDFIEGRTLRQLTQDAPLTATRAARYLQCIAEAVHFAHQRGVVHRDLKPSNVLIDADDRPHVTDFGLAKRIGSEADLTVSGAAMGTPGYMPPEQALGQSKSVGPLADVYALGAMLYDLLTGRPPFRAETPLETMSQAVNKDPVAPHLLNASVPRDLETICLKCLEKDPARRYSSAQELALDVDRFLKHQPIHARAPSPLYRARKFFRRHRAGVSIAASFALLLIAATVVSTILARNARRAEREASAVLAFFRDKVLAAAAPAGQSGGLGHDVSLRAALKSAELAIPEAFADQPLPEASIRAVLAVTYHHLGEYTNAIRQQERVLELRRKHRGPDHPTTLQSMHNLALSLGSADRLQEATALDELTLARRKIILGLNHSGTLNSMLGVANDYYRAGRRTEALKLLEEAFRLSQTMVPPDPDDQMACLNNLANGYSSAGRAQEAFKLYDQAFQLSKARFGLEHPATLSTLHNLASAYDEIGDKAKSLATFEEALRLRRATLGEEHPETISTLQNFASTLKSHGDVKKALNLYEETVALRKVRLGPNDPATIRSLIDYANTKLETGATSDAIGLLEESVELLKAKMGPNHPSTLNACSSLAQAYQTAGRRTNAVALFEDTLPRMRTVLGPGHRDTLAVMYNLVSAYRAAGRITNAIPLAEEVLGLREQRYGPDNLDTLMCMNNLANLYGAVGRRAEALRLYEGAAQRMTATLPATHRERLRVAANLASTYLNAERFADAEKWYRDVITQRATLVPADDLELARLRNNLGVCLLPQQQYQEAETLFRQALSVYRQKQPGLGTVYENQGQMGWALFGQKKFAEAEPNLLQAYEGYQQRQAKAPSAFFVRAIEDSRKRLVQFYEAWDKPEEAAKWKATR